MAKSPIDIMGLRSFAKHIRRKLSQPPRDQQAAEARIDSSTPTEPDLLQTILDACREIAASDGNAGALARVVIAEMVLPKVFYTAKGDDPLKGRRVNHKEAKAYAFACGQIAGLLAGLSLQEPAIDGALDEVLARAKEDARRTIKILNKHGFHGVPLNGAPVKEDSGVSPAAQAKQDETTAALAMIDDLERQAAAEKDLAHAAALRVMASNMKRELFAKATEDQSSRKDSAA